MFLLTLRDLQFRAVRFGIAIIGTALVFAMVLLMSGLSAQFRNEPVKTITALGGDGWVTREGPAGAFTSGVLLGPDAVDQVMEAGASDATPIVIFRQAIETGDGDAPPKDVVLFGYERGGIVPDPEIDEGDPADDFGEIVASNESNLEPGDELTLGGEPFTVTGTTSERTISGGTPLLFMEFEDAAALRSGGAEGPALPSAVIVDGDVAQIRSSLADDLQIRTVEETAEDARRPLEKPVGAIDVVQYLLWLVAATIIGAVVYLSALERRRDFAVMKAVGASSRGLLAGLAAQSVIVALVAAAIAALIAFGLVPMFPIAVDIPVGAFIRLPILALAAGALASLGGLRKAVNVDPALAFAGPGG